MLHEPLRGDERLHDRFAALAVPRLSVYGSIFTEQAELPSRHDAFARFEAIESRVRAGGRGHAGVFVDHLDRGQIVAFAGFESFGSCAG